MTRTLSWATAGLMGIATAAAQNYEACYFNTGTYPSNATNWWMYNGLEVQGVTNDGENWYFTLTAQDHSNAMLWRIPKDVDLNADPMPSDPGILVTTMLAVPDLYPNYWHWGDPDHYRYLGVDYLLVPIPGPIVACFRADDLQFIGYAHLDDSHQDYAGWCAIGSGGDLYSCGYDLTSLVRYDINWSALIAGDQNAITYIETIPMLDSNGDPIVPMQNMQGGEFSNTGEMLYLVSGRGECVGVGEVTPEDGVHVFSTSTWRRQRRSLDTGDLTVPFAFEYDETCTCGVFGWGSGSQTPEGLTYWDLDGGSAPNVRGQLHVLVDHYNEYAVCDDAVTMKHYSHNIRVNGSNGYAAPTNPRTGTVSRPFQTINEAYDFYPLWNGAHMVIEAGTYDDTGLYDKRIRMESRNGAALIGQQ